MVAEVVKICFNQKVTTGEKEISVWNWAQFQKQHAQVGFMTRVEGQWMENYEGITYIIYRGKGGFLFNIYFIYLFGCIRLWHGIWVL